MLCLQSSVCLRLQTLLNDLDVSSSHMERLIKDLVSAPTIPQSFLIEEVPTAKSCISAFNNLVPKFRSMLRVSPINFLFALGAVISLITRPSHIFSSFYSPASNSSSINYFAQRCATSSLTYTKMSPMFSMKMRIISRNIKILCESVSLRHGKDL